MAFSPREELLWAGAESGALYAMALPPLRTYSSVRAHALPLVDLAPLGDGVVSVSANALQYHASGGRELVALVDLPVRTGQHWAWTQGWEGSVVSRALPAFEPVVWLRSTFTSSNKTSSVQPSTQARPGRASPAS